MGLILASGILRAQTRRTNFFISSQFGEAFIGNLDFFPRHLNIHLCISTGDLFWFRRKIFLDNIPVVLTCFHSMLFLIEYHNVPEKKTFCSFYFFILFISFYNVNIKHNSLKYSQILHNFFSGEILGTLHITSYPGGI